MRLAIVTALTAVAAAAAAGTAAAGYHGQIHIDYRYTSGGGGLRPGGPADIEQTAHLVLTVANGRIRHLHGVVGFDYKWINTGCPNFTVETIGGGTVDDQPVGDGFAFIDDWNWTPPRHGHYVTPAPAVPQAPVTSKTTSPANDCSTLHQTDRATFEIGYVPALVGTTKTSKRIVGSLTRNYQGFDACHPFSPLPPPPPVGVSCTWRLRWTLTR
jgi:hypothetical protein